jgi:hypothetical protein
VLKRVGRVLTNVLAALSALLFLTTIVFWVRGQWHYDTLRYLRILAVNDPPAGYRDELGRWRVPWVSHDAHGRRIYVSSAAGCVQLSVTEGGADTLDRRWQYRHHGDTEVAEASNRGFFSDPVGWGFPGFRVRTDSSTSFQARAKCWLLACLTAAVPVWRAGRFLARRRRLRRLALDGHCRRCGYDLRATPDPAGPRLPACPECGAAEAGNGAAARYR